MTNLNVDTKRLITIDCPLCGSKSWETIFHSMDVKVSMQYFDIVQCEDCEFVFTNPRPMFEDLKRYYGKNYYSYKPPKFERETSVKKNGKKLLDIGCGSGNLMIRKINEGYEAYGVEIDPEVVQNAQKIGLNVTLADMKALNFNDNFFDEIFLINVLEHIFDINSIMHEIYRSLKPGGILVLKFPNIQSYDAALFKECWRPLDVPRHLSHFSPKTIQQLLKKHRFQPIFIETRNIPLFSERYIKGCYTTCKTAYHLSKGMPIIRWLKSIFRVILNATRYGMHRKIKNDGYLILVRAEKV